MERVLIANRGEIALRIIRTLREMGISSLAIFSEADRDAPFVLAADEAVCIGPPPSSESYLDMDRIIELAKSKKIDAIHPGYGFLSENSEFARKLAKAHITLIGPSPEAMELMGSKLAAKATVAKYNIPMVPGTDHAIKDVQEGFRTAQEIGFPVLIKASAGGGGKGMRIVNSPDEFEEQLQRAISEAESSFGDGSVFIERYVTSPRHIEIQVLADTHGNIIHLCERECSIQRRHQKVIEEAPSAILSTELRNQMGEAAVNVARSCNYVGAGTVEFLVDENLEFYFLEMNTRLQVEHPVTELITGVDLVREQVNIARGEPLRISQEDISIRGHAIELRVYAEDPENDFLPDIGELKAYSPPSGPGVRVDDGFRQGMKIPVFYDPMISKLCVHAESRATAIQRMKRAIEEYQIIGVKNTLTFGHFVMEHPAFISGEFDTGFVASHYRTSQDEVTSADELDSVLAIMAEELHSKSQNKIPTSDRAEGPAVSNWRTRRTTEY